MGVFEIKREQGLQFRWSRTKKNHIYILILSVILISAASIFLITYKPLSAFGKDGGIEKVFPSKPADNFSYSENMKLKVNGEEITSGDVEKQYEKIPPELKGNITRNQVLESMITQRLLLQEAGRKGITATDGEIDKYLGQARTLSGLDETALEEKISKSGYTLDEYRTSVRELLTESKLLDQELNLKNVQASDADVNSFIQKNKAELQDVFAEGDQGLETILEKRVKQKLTQEKRQVLVNNYIESLKQGAKIE